MKIYITRINGWGLWNRSHYMQHMVAEIAHQMGYQEMGIYRYNADDESQESLSSRLDGIIAGINRGDFVICQFPTGNGRRFEYELVNRLKAYGGRIAIYIHGLESLAWEEKKNQIEEIVGLYNLAEVLIVPSYAMRRLLTENGIRKEMKFVIQEIWDCPVDENFLRIPILKKEIQYAGDVGFEGMENWGGTIPLKLYGVSTNKGQNVSNMNIPSNEFCRELSNGGFGLVWYTDRENRQYMEYSIPFSLSRYLASGIPVIVPIGSVSQTLITAEHLGVGVNSLNEAVAVVERIDEKEYQQYARNVRTFALALRTGYYTRKCLIDAVHAFCRKDADRIMIPACNYYPSDYEFNSVVLRESYGGNLALSWSFKGKPDGFLIYDASGALVYETKNVHMHYFLIENHKRGNTFIVKAYVDTLKGRLIVAEASSSLRIMQYEKPKVSLLMSAYNAEDFIARGIDTALAQSFQALEIVVVDDGSEDSTSDIIDWYDEKYYNVIAIHQKNGGTPAGRNAGIKYAHGEYIGFLDSDDMLHPDMISRLYNAIRADDCDIAITSMYLIQNDGYSILAQYPMEENVTVTVDNFFSMHFDTGCMFATVVVNKLYRSSLVKEHLFPIMQVEDNAWTPYLLSYAEKIRYINDCSYEYDRTIYTNTVTDKLALKPKEELYSIHKNAIMFYLENGNPKRMVLLKRLARRQLSEMGRAYKYNAYEKLWMEIDKDFHTV